MKILIVEQSSKERDYFQWILKNAGFEVISANDCNEGIEMLYQAPDIELIISDSDIPNIGAYNMIKRVRKEEKFVNVPIIIISKGDKATEQKRGFAAGVNAYIFKPIEPEILVENIKMLTMNE